MVENRLDAKLCGESEALPERRSEVDTPAPRKGGVRVVAPAPGLAMQDRLPIATHVDASYGWVFGPGTGAFCRLGHLGACDGSRAPSRCLRMRAAAIGGSRSWFASVEVFEGEGAGCGRSAVVPNCDVDLDGVVGGELAALSIKRNVNECAVGR